MKAYMLVAKHRDIFLFLYLTFLQTPNTDRICFMICRDYQNIRRKKPNRVKTAADNKRENC